MLYAASGRPTAAIVNDPNRMIDTTLFWMAVKTMMEASYLVAIINSRTLEERLAPLMPKGQFGARHVQKHLWRLPIPQFNPHDGLHQEIAALGEAAERQAQVVWHKERAARLAKKKPTSVTVARRTLRAWLAQSAIGQEIDRLVARLLS